MKSKDEIFDEVLGKEGGYVNHPDDKGGPTKWGITEKVARAHGYQGQMYDLTRGKALEILERTTGMDLVLTRWQTCLRILLQNCDTGVNMGPSVASKMLQRWLNVFNQKGTLYPDMDVDGRIGSRTLNALRAYLSKRGRDGELALVKALNCTQGERYLALAEKREANESFVYGWLKQRVIV
uniref:Endolysin n=1 Tax=Escherichia coli TaxID=562 RepID=H6W8G3_ECOLX|nr:putative phage lysozyme [Escherichia coli]ALO79779.1 endolysin [Escherichia coli]